MGVGPTDEDLERLADARVVASISGGKDSAALSLWLTEHGIDHDRLFADTGWEHPLTYEYLRGPLTDAIGPITEVRSEIGGFVQLARKKKMLPSRPRRFCTFELKVKPILAHLQTYDCEIVNAVGIRAAESRARANDPRWEQWDDMDCDVWRPLIDWSEADVIAMHRRHGLMPNPLYLKGAERVGCWPCIFSRKREIALVAKMTPERIDEIRELETELADGARARFKARGETFESHNRPTFFHHKSKKRTPIPIDEVVAWSRTSHGGRQLILLDREPPGCVRWGLCEGPKGEPGD